MFFIKNSFYNDTIEKVIESLQSSTAGLSKNEAKNRLDKNGYNRLPRAKKEGLFQIIINQIKSPLIAILFAIMILSLFMHEAIEAIFIAIVILIDIGLGAFQEWKAGKNSESLEKMITFDSIVIRDGKKIEINSELLVIGDIVYIESGDKVSADMRLIETKNLSIDESILTGESQASEKDFEALNSSTSIASQRNMAFAGTSVITGRGIGIIVSTGIDTEIGKIANSVLTSDSTPSPLVVRMEKFIKQISYAVLVVGIILGIVLYMKGYDLNEIFFAVVGLSVSIIPEGLPIALTTALSIASSRMSKKNVIVKKINSVESLGSCTIIATDKTGTLTINEQTAKKIILPDGRHYSIEGNGYNGIGKVTSLDNNNDFNDVNFLAELGVTNNEAKLTLENDAWTSHGDYVDIAFLSLGYKLNITNKTKEIVGTIPYESENKYSAVFYKEDGMIYCSVKGSFETILEFSDRMFSNGQLVNIDRDLLIKQNDELAKSGYRVISIAQGLCENFSHSDELTSQDIPMLGIVGLVAFQDPVRTETVGSISKCQRAGIKVIMITGDHPLTAYSIGKELNITNSIAQVATGDDLELKYDLGEKVFDEFIKNKFIFARTTPIQKLLIVDSFKRQGEFVAVTGDGVNDAPAMKAANIGVAMGSGTDVAKETGTMIITNDNFLSIVDGIEEGRNAYNNVRKVVYLLTSTGFAEFLFIFLSILFNLPLPLIAVQLLWLNLVTNGVQDVALAFEKGDETVMNEQPRSPNEKIFNGLLLQETIVSGLWISLVVFFTWIYLIDFKNFDINIARGYILTLMVFIQNFHVFNCRNELKSAFKVPFKNNYFIVIGVIGALALQFFATTNASFGSIIGTTPIPLNDIIILVCLASPILIVMELFKYIKRKNRKL